MGKFTRHCMVCSEDYGCCDEETKKECINCPDDTANCENKNHPVTTGICNKCWQDKGARKEYLVGRLTAKSV